MRRRTDHLHVTALGARELEALRLVEQQPRLTIAELADALGVSLGRT